MSSNPIPSSNAASATEASHSYHNIDSNDGYPPQYAPTLHHSSSSNTNTNSNSQNYNPSNNYNYKNGEAPKVPLSETQQQSQQQPSGDDTVGSTEFDDDDEVFEKVDLPDAALSLFTLILISSMVIVLGIMGYRKHWLDRWFGYRFHDLTLDEQVTTDDDDDDDMNDRNSGTLIFDVPVPVDPANGDLEMVGTYPQISSYEPTKENGQHLDDETSPRSTILRELPPLS